MADLDSCYFCGTIGDGLTELAVVPPRFDPTDKQQRTVVLCTTCRQKLGTVLEPIVDVLGDGTETTDDGSSSASAPDTPSPSPNSVDTDNDIRTGEDVTDAATTPTAPQPGDAIDTTDFDDPLASDSEGVTIGTPVADGETDERHGSDESGSGDGDGNGDAETGASNTDAGIDTAADDADADAADSVDEADADSDASKEEPTEFRTVMRLLSNREFPVDRAEIEALASGAYSLDDSQAGAIIDYAVDRGVLAERDGQLHRD
ncbi:hypothetical protein [Haloprofundus salilacus]|uniref:hypothetical protein n=1 Tax=Haloprofundus salilacus TaxID=2876190 RepID=UPI001CD00272|nr:hypothetical protein [Haloprofundus salilacus]